jgi:hypothetical protein
MFWILTRNLIGRTHMSLREALLGRLVSAPGFVDFGKYNLLDETLSQNKYIHELFHKITLFNSTCLNEATLGAIAPFTTELHLC